MALTATATDRVQKDVLKNLKMTQALVLKQSFNRPNLTYVVLKKSKKDQVRSIQPIDVDSCLLFKSGWVEIWRPLFAFV